MKRNEDAIVRERIADAVLDNEGRNFWAEIKRIRSSKASNCRIVDEMTDAGSISKMFADKYRDLYTSVPYNVREMQCIVDRVNCLLQNEEHHNDCTFNIHDIKSAVLHLKAHKGDGSSGLSTDHIIHAGDDCLIHIACLFTSIVVHGSVPDSCLVSTILPIPKGRNVNTSDSSNYRGIALS